MTTAPASITTRSVKSFFCIICHSIAESITPCMTFSSFRPVSCTMMPAQAFTTTAMLKVDDTSSIPRSRFLLHKLVQSFAKTSLPLKRKPEGSSKGSRKPLNKVTRYVPAGSKLTDCMDTFYIW